MAIPVPYSYRRYTGDGVARDFSVPFPYLQKAHVHVFLNSKELKDGTDYNWTSGTQIKLLLPPQAPVIGTPPIPAQVLTVRRITPEDDQIVQWKDGSYIIQEDLNESDKQWLYLIQEHHDELVLLLNGDGSIPGDGNPVSSLAFWNRLSINQDPDKGTPAQLAETIDRLDQVLGDWPKDGKDGFVATTDAISARLDPYVQDGVPAPLGMPEKEQHGKTWFDTDDLQQRFWDADAGAWVTLANTGPAGPKGDAGGFGTPTAAGLPAGSAPTVTASGPDTAKVFAFGIPKGDQGVPGPTGAAAGFGAPTITTLPAGSTATVAASGPDTAKVFAFGIPKGDKGDKGDPGAAAASYVLPAATAAALGGVKTGANITIAADGTISASVAGALVYRGTTDLTAAPPATPVAGDVYISNKAGTVAAGWTGAAGLTTSPGDMVLWSGTKWDLVSATAAGAGVTSVTGTLPITIGGTAADPDVRVADATAAAKGVVQLADAAAITAGTAGRVVDAAQLKAVSDGDDWTRTGTTLAPKTAGDVVSFSAGTAALPGLTPVGDPNTGLWAVGADTLGISTNGVERLRVDASGRVGIGTQPSVWRCQIRDDDQAHQLILTNASGKPAETSGLLLSNDVHLGGWLTLNQSTHAAEPNQLILGAKAGGIGVDVTGNRRLTIDTGGTSTFYSNPNTPPAIFRIGASEVARFHGTGRFLLGTSTPRAVAAISAGMQVESAAYSFASQSLANIGGDALGPYFMFGKARSTTSGLVSNGDELGSLFFAGGDGTNINNIGAKIVANVDGVAAADFMPGRLSFYTTLAGGTPSERLRIDTHGTSTFTSAAGSGPVIFKANTSEVARIDSNGRLGIGTSSPSCRLDINTPGNSLAFRTQVGGVTFFSVTHNSQGAIVDFSDNGGTLRNRIDGRSDRSPSFFNAGNVGFGTTTPAAKLTVKGNAVGEPATLTDAATITPDFAAANHFNLTLAATGHTLADPTNLVPGQSGCIVIANGGAFTLAYGTAWKFQGGTKPTLPASATSVLTYYVASPTMIVANLIGDVK